MLIPAKFCVFRLTCGLNSDKFTFRGCGVIILHQGLAEQEFVILLCRDILTKRDSKSAGVMIKELTKICHSHCDVVGSHREERSGLSMLFSL